MLKVKLGWDVTDHDSGDFDKIGAVQFCKDVGTGNMKVHGNYLKYLSF